MTSDSNAGALDAGLDTAISFIDVAPISCIRHYADKICLNVIDKALGATKASTVTKYVIENKNMWGATVYNTYIVNIICVYSFVDSLIVLNMITLFKN